MIRQLRTAIADTRREISVMTAIYAITVFVGAVMAHTGNTFALGYRDRLIRSASRNDPAARADDSGAHLKAAALDFTRNLTLVAVPDTVGGFIFVIPLGLGAYRGWVGGIVSVDHDHHSRLRHLRSAIYFIVTLLLQLTGFTLAGAAGLHLGWAFVQARGPFVGPRWFAVSKPALVNAGWLYVLIVPVLAIGSWWEFAGPAR